MRLRSVTLCNVRRFARPVRLDGLTDGLNLLSQPNEFGKSTIFDAIHALFFVAHSSQGKEAKALRPQSGGAPEVEVEIETDQGRATIAKRWFAQASATVHLDGRLVAQADAAEAWIAALLGGDGPAGLIWVRQGLTGLSTGNKKEDASAHAARADLMSSVGHEVDEMTGGKRMDAALARCRADLAIYATATGRPITAGPWKAALARVETLTVEHAALQETAQKLRQDLEARRRARRELAEWQAPEAVQDRADRLQAARASHSAAERHAQEIEAAATKVTHAELELTRAAERLEQYRAAVTERSDAGSAAQAAKETADAAQKRRATAEAAFRKAAEAQSAAEAKRDSTDAARRAAEALQRAQDGARHRADLADQIARAEAARTSLESAEAAARLGPDPAFLKQLEAAALEVQAARAAQDAAAPHIVMRYAPDRHGSVQIGTAPLPEGQPVPITGSTTLSIDGIGTLEVHPADGSGVEARARQSEAALRRALQTAGFDDLPSVQAAAIARKDAEAAAAEARTILKTLAPDGLAPLRAALSAIPALPQDQAPAPDLTAALAAADAAQATLTTAQAVRDAAAEQLSDARSTAAGLDSAATAARDRLSAAENRLARLESDEPTLDGHRSRAATALRAAQALLADLRRQAPDLGTATAALRRAESVEATAQAESARLQTELAALDARVTHSAGDAVEERLATTADALAEAQADLERIEHEVAVLQRLAEALDTARTEAREQYFRPVVAELRPLLQMLWPDAELTWGADTLLPETLIRAGSEEPLGLLSGGTQEQIAVLVRLAFARLLQRSGQQAPVILDDALVFTDDDRIEAMFHALHRQAADLQIVVLTCRQRAFRDLGANMLSLRELPQG